MTADPKARRLATEFFGQWLGFYHFDEYRGVDTGRFPEFTDEVKSAMYDEAISTFEYIVRRDRPVKEMLFADYTFLNKPLAKFYGIERDVKSRRQGGAGGRRKCVQSRRRAAPGIRVDDDLGAAAHEPGQARRLGAAAHSRHADAAAAGGRGHDAGGRPDVQRTHVRERLAEHKRNATCANCHLRIDPLGLSARRFRRGRPARTTYSDGKAVDVTGEFADKTTIVGAQGLLTYLQTQDTQLMTTVSKKMIGYALGRTVRGSDRPLVDAMASAGGDASFSDLAVTIVTSRQFRNRVGGETAVPRRGRRADAEPEALRSEGATAVKSSNR